jgi:hypothetical protein
MADKTYETAGIYRPFFPPIPNFLMSLQANKYTDWNSEVFTAIRCDQTTRPHIQEYRFQMQRVGRSRKYEIVSGSRGYVDCLDNVRSLTSHNRIGHHGLLQG